MIKSLGFSPTDNLHLHYTATSQNITPFSQCKRAFYIIRKDGIIRSHTTHTHSVFPHYFTHGPKICIFFLLQEAFIRLIYPILPPPSTYIIDFKTLSTIQSCRISVRHDCSQACFPTGSCTSVRNISDSLLR